MNKSVQNNMYKILSCLVCIFAAICLVGYIDEITLTTTLQRMFVGCYFVVLLYSLLWLIKKKLLRLLKRKNLFSFIGIVCIAVWAILMGSNFVPKQMLDNHIKISIMESANKDAQGQEVWLKGIYLNGKEQTLEQYANESLGWTLVGNVICGSYGSSSELSLILPNAKEVKLKFGKHAWSGIVQMQYGNGYVEYDLYDSTGSDFDVRLPGQAVPYTGLKQWILIAGYYALCLVVVGLVIVFLNRKKN